MLVRVQVRANITTVVPHQYVYVYMCMYMSHNSVAQTMNVRLLRRLKKTTVHRYVVLTDGLLDL